MGKMQLIRHCFEPQKADKNTMIAFFYFLLDFGDLLTSFSMLTLGNVQENLTLRSLTRIGVHEALVLVLRLVE